MNTITRLSFRVLTLIAGLLVSLPGTAQEYSYAYEGQILRYTVIDNNAKTCITKAREGSDTPGNKISGALVIPAVIKQEIPNTASSVSEKVLLTIIHG